MKIHSDVIIILTMGIIAGLIYNSGNQDKLFDLVTNKSWVIGMFFIIMFSLYILSITGDVDIFGKRVFSNKEDIPRIKTSIKKGFIALLIALCAELSLTLAPFWAVFLASYFLDNIV